MTQEQQQEIRRLRAMGEGYKRIGAILNLSVNTVKSFCRRDSAVNSPQSQEKGNQAACLRCGQPLAPLWERRRACRIIVCADRLQTKNRCFHRLSFSVNFPIALLWRSSGTCFARD